MTPYYQDDLVTLYLADCREFMPSADVVVSDPPYGNEFHPVRGRYKAIVGDGEAFDPAPILALGLPTVLWGANHYASRLPDSPSWFIWDKRGDVASNLQADVELAWSNLGGPARLVRQYWNGGSGKHAERVAEGQAKGSFHPNQKPLGVMRWVISRCPDGVILDPYAGSGSTLIAAKSLGRRAIGIEIEARWADRAAQRLSQEVLELVG